MMALVDELGFDAVDDGTLHESCGGSSPARLAVRRRLARRRPERCSPAWAPSARPEQQQQFAANHAEAGTPDDETDAVVAG
ncbi:MAG: hypothetical protein WKG07_32455 [Hymenobacter sp.]